MPIPKPTVVRVDKEPNHRLAGLFCKKRTRALVVEADTATLPLFALDQTALPRWVGLPHVVPEASEEGEVATVEGAGQVAGERGDASQVINEELPLTSIVPGMRVEQRDPLTQHAT